MLPTLLAAWLVLTGTAGALLGGVVAVQGAGRLLRRLVRAVRRRPAGSSGAPARA